MIIVSSSVVCQTKVRSTDQSVTRRFTHYDEVLFPDLVKDHLTDVCVERWRQGNLCPLVVSAHQQVGFLWRVGENIEESKCDHQRSYVNFRYSIKAIMDYTLLYLYTLFHKGAYVKRLMLYGCLLCWRLSNVLMSHG